MSNTIFCKQDKFLIYISNQIQIGHVVNKEEPIIYNKVYS